MTDILVSIADSRWQAIPDCRPRIAEAAQAALAQGGLPDTLRNRAELGVELSDDAAVHGLNRHFRNRDAPTNVLSFPGYAAIADMGDADHGDAPPILLGDVILAYETVHREADDQGKSLAAHALHLTVHGVLHLLGFDHDTAETAATMEGLERRILAEFGIADPYRTQTKGLDTDP